jgi:hypothetical protein
MTLVEEVCTSTKMVDTSNKNDILNQFKNSLKKAV